MEYVKINDYRMLSYVEKWIIKPNKQMNWGLWIFLAITGFWFGGILIDLWIR